MSLEEKESYYQWALKKGISRRNFLKFCTAMGAMLGLEASALPKIVNAMETKPRIPVIYLNLQECTCCSESFIRSGHPLVADLILNMISLDYMEVLQAAAGDQAEAAKQKTMKDFFGKYLLVVEGSVATGDGGVYCTIGGKTTQSVLEEAAEGALAVVAYGSCAVNACVQGSAPNPTNAVPVKEIITNKPVINVPGCPPIAEVITGTIVYYLTFGTLPELTNQGRPKAFYQHRIHDNCNRRAFFDAGQFVESFDDEGAKQGWCLYKMGCKGPTTYNACAITQWNDGLSYPIKSGHPCLGCSEDHFFDKGPFYTHLADVPNHVIGKNPDQIGLIGLGVAGAAAGAHALATAAGKAGKTSTHNSPKDKSGN
ncbi:uptake hydrogenase small subunit precursor [Desulfosporosinus acididurans]|uniref:Uptake hydrogenase small subunit n=1 Tax=Desulfosporosinus acididurans TaxID=476652 RepID=A0A0J1ISQ4_9FIRM|nr:uptake hydrogenase small subunit precursor [Desulfosporosinus acididurans]